MRTEGDSVYFWDKTAEDVVPTWTVTPKWERRLNHMGYVLN